LATPKISLAIPAYNGEKYIEQALLSVLNQTYPAYEIIISDDGSQDQTLKIIKSVYKEHCLKYAKNIPLIIKLNPDGPSGFVNAWNRAISMASGDFISILHQDDILYPQFLEEFVRAHKQYPNVRHFFAPCDYIDGEGIILRKFESAQNDIVLYKKNEYMKAYQKSYGVFPHIHRCPGVITHRSIFEEGCQYSPEAGHIADDDFFYRVGQLTDVVGIMKTMGAFRIHSDSETGSIGNTSLVKRLARDYIYQVYQWQNSTFLDRNDKYYFEFSAVKAVTRNLIFAFKLNDPSFYNESLSCFIQLRKYKFMNSLFLQRLKMYLVWLLLLCKGFWRRY
jgi:glycosyltransferase involved in cell wall biosynthesis